MKRCNETHDAFDRRKKFPENVNWILIFARMIFVVAKRSKTRGDSKTFIGNWKRISRFISTFLHNQINFQQYRSNTHKTSIYEIILLSLQVEDFAIEIKRKKLEFIKSLRSKNAIDW